jgi:hypothetical protein
MQESSDLGRQATILRGIEREDRLRGEHLQQAVQSA